MTLASYAVGRVQASEGDFYLTGRLAKRDQSARAVLWCHQGATLASSLYDRTNQSGTAALLEAIADAGYLVAGQDLGAMNPMGNNTAKTRTGSTVTWAQTAAIGASSSKPVVLVGISQGFVAAVRWAAANPTLVAAFVGVLPFWDMRGEYASNALGLRAQIQTAWGITHPTPLPTGASANDSDNTTPLAAKPAYVAYATDDGICTPTHAGEIVAAFAGSTSVSLGALGHTNAAIAAVDKPSLISWLRTVAAP